MRILRVIGSADPIHGGPIEGVRRQAEVMAAMGHTTTIASLDAPDAESVVVDDLAPARHVALGRGWSAWRWSPRALSGLKALAREHDCLVIEGVWVFHAYAARAAARAAGIPYVVFPHGMLDPYFKRRHPLKHLKKWLFWPWAEYRVLRDAAAVCFTCEEERRLARESFPRLYRARERVVAFGAAAPPPPGEGLAAALADAVPELGDAPYLLFLSRVHPKKGLDLAIRAFAEIADESPNLRLVVAGPDPSGWGETLRPLADSLGVGDRVLWPGMLHGDAKWGALYRAEALLLPSHQENFGIVVAEALACATPVLISDKVNIWREVRDDGAGLVDSDDLAGTLRSLRQWLAASEERREAWRAAAQRSFLRRFRVETACDSLVRVLREAAAP